MPKKPSDKVVTYRIEFQESERQILKDFVTTNAVGDVAELLTSIDKMLTFENLYIGATIYEILSGREVILGTPNDLDDLLGMLKDYFKEYNPLNDPILNLLIPGSGALDPAIAAGGSLLNGLINGLAGLGNRVDDVIPDIPNPFD